MKDTSLTEIKTKAETTPSAEAAPAETEKPEVDVTNAFSKNTKSQYLWLLLWDNSLYFFFYLFQEVVSSADPSVI